MTSLRLSLPGGPEVSALLDRPADPTAILVLAHGAGAGMDHAFMEALTERLVARRIAVFRFNFGYMEEGRFPPDRVDVATEAVATAVAEARRLEPELTLLGGGKSFGGRMTTEAAARGMLPGVTGIVLVGFPLHPAKKPGTTRARHLADVPLPMLFLQGDRDALARMDLMEPVVRELGERATLHVVEGADHGFHVLKRSGRTDEEVLEELGDVVGEWVEG